MLRRTVVRTLMPPPPPHFFGKADDTEEEEDGAEINIMNRKQPQEHGTIIQLQVVAASGVSHQECHQVVFPVLAAACQAYDNGANVRFLLSTSSASWEEDGPIRVVQNDDDTAATVPAPTITVTPPGATGRVLVLRATSVERNGATTISDPHVQEDESVLLWLSELQSVLAQALDPLVRYPSVRDKKETTDMARRHQPILLSILPPPAPPQSSCSDGTAAHKENDDEDETTTTDPESLVQAAIQTHVDDYGLVEPFHHPMPPRRRLRDDDDDEDGAVGRPPVRLPPPPPPQQHIQLDGATVVDPATGRPYWDVSSVFVWDDLLLHKTSDLRQRLLDVVLGHAAPNDGDYEEDGGRATTTDRWNDVTHGPDPRRWVKGGLTDIPELDNSEGGAAAATGAGAAGGGAVGVGGGYGLSVEAIEELCFQHHDAIAEFEGILAILFPRFRVTRLPEAVLGASVSPLTANAPVHGQEFQYHIDADPNLAPPSPWTDVFGMYPNRARGKPRFVSCLVYLNDEWDFGKWGAPTRFLDGATHTTYDVHAKPGRVVVMDQDITHTVVAPHAAAGHRPRYSLVWKLILHPTVPRQDMERLFDNGGDDDDDDADNAAAVEMPQPIRIGSAAFDAE